LSRLLPAPGWRLSIEPALNALQLRSDARLIADRGCQENTMNRDKLLMFAAVLMACAGFLMLTHSVHAGSDEWFARTTVEFAAIR